MLAYSGSNFTIDSCYSLATISGTTYFGFIADSWASSRTVSNSYFFGTTLSNKAGSRNIVCTNVYGENANYYAGVTELAKANMQGEDALVNFAKMPALANCGSFVATEGYPVLRVFKALLPKPKQELWSDSVKAPEKDPEGGENDYLISTPEELSYVIKNGGGKSYKLTNDIYLNDPEKIDWSTGSADSTYISKVWYTANTAGNFYGTLDGDGHTIYGLYVNNEEDCVTALIPALRINQPTVVKNLGIDNAYFGTKGKAAAIISQTNYNNTVTISNCYVGEKVTIKGTHAAAMLAYSGSNFTIDSCYSLATISGTTYFGFIADSWASSRTVSNCFFVGSSLSSKSGSILCENVFSDDNSRYNVTKLDPAQMQGEDVLDIGGAMEALADCDNFVATEGYPVLRVFTDLLPTPEEPEGDIWSGKVAKKIKNGSGTENDPYLIYNGAELAYATKNQGLDGAYFLLQNDIYLNDTTKSDWYSNTDNNSWISSAGFNGHLNGNGYIVYGIWYASDTSVDKAGLIPVFTKGSVKNIGVRFSQINAQTFAGGIVGATAIGGYKEITNCFADETVKVAYVSANNGGAGGILGYAAYEPSTDAVLKIANCYSKVGLSGYSDNRLNGIVGTAWQCPYVLENTYSVGYAPYFASTVNFCSWLYSEGKPLNEIYKNNYSTEAASGDFELYTKVAELELMKGESAKSSMSGLDFEETFQTVDGSTPKLKVFKNFSGEELDLTGDREAYASGKGTKNDPFIIKTADQLRYLLKSPNTKNRYYELGADIYLNDTSDKNWQKNSPNVWYTDSDSEVFYGSLDGKGFKIYGLYLGNTPTPFDEKENKFDKTAAGLFPQFSVMASVCNLHIRDSFISGSGYTGAIIGKITNAETGLYARVVGCSADSSVTVRGQTVGGLVAGGTNRGLKLYSSYFTGKVTATAKDRANALVGDIWGKDWELLDCYSAGANAYRFSIIPNLVGALYGTEWITGSKQISLKDMTGEAARTAMDELDWNNVWMTVDGSTPHQKLLAPDFIPKVFDEGSKGGVWSGYFASKYASGEGTKESPYIIETPEQLAKLMLDPATAGKYYKLGADIRLNDTSSENWTKTARQWFGGTSEFAGNFDGNGHVVSGLYFNTEFAYAGLFPQITSGAVIRRVGITRSSVTVSGEESYAGALVGRIVGWNFKDEDFVTPVISQCFADHTVKISCYNAGGLVGGCGMMVDIDNCYFTGRLYVDGNYGGQIIANAWNTRLPITVKNSFFVSDDGITLSGHPTGASMMELTNVYHRGTRGNVNGATNIALMMIRGSGAKTVMPELDYKNIWMIVDGGTPVLRCFKNAENYSNKQLPKKVEISFASMEGSACESIFGYPQYTELLVSSLPVPERYGYKFGGWYHSVNFSTPVKDGLFPDFDTVFYAKWISVGFTEDFDGDLDPNYDYNSSVESFRPGVMGYTPSLVHGGLKSIHAKGDGKEAPRFLLSYKNALEVGQVYDVIIYITTDDESLTSAKLKVYHANHPQFDSDMAGYEEFSIAEIQKGKWQKVTMAITANAPYLVIETEAGKSLYFDSLQVVPVGKMGDLGLLEKDEEVLAPEPKPQEEVKEAFPWTAVIAVSAVAVIALAAVCLFAFIKRKKN